MTTTARNRPPALWRWFMKVQNPFMKRLLCSPLHGLVSRIYMLITVTGRKTGRRYTTPVQYMLEGDTVTVVTSQGYTWWKNLRDGAPIELRLRGQTLRGYAQTTTDTALIADAVGRLYPKQIPPEKRAAFAVGKVLITIALEERLAP